MCGIAGWIGPPSPQRNRAAAARMLAALAHRGPDGEGEFHALTASGDEVFLGHRRLAIIDPTQATQPMSAPDAGITLVFNGEIYNFRELRRQLTALGHTFHCDSDTEVLLRAYVQWNEQVVHRLRGMFAFAVWDQRRQRLFLARDRFGEKPLFWHMGPGGLCFASEIKALLVLPECRHGTDLAAVRDCLAWRYVPAPRTLHTGIRKVMPGSAAVWEQGRWREWRYWVPPDRAPHRAHATAPPNPVPEFLHLLDDAVRSQMVSDVPFGAFLSGGLDSSTIVALMRRHTNALRTYSVGFADDRNSELPFAARVAREFGTSHREINVAPGDVLATLPALIGYRDAPVSEPSDVAIHLMAREASRDVKMVLTGEGSDEVLGGYPKHAFERLAGPFQSLPPGLCHRLVLPLVQALPYRFRRVKIAARNLAVSDWRERYVGWFGALGRSELGRLVRVGASRGPLRGTTPVVPFDAEPDTSGLRRLLYFDQTSWLPDNLLERGDRMTMAASLESRVPFLDHELAAFVSSLPDHYRVRGLRTKWLLREAARSLLPKLILERPKVGFRVPIDQWFRGAMRGYLREHLCGADSVTRPWYHAAVLDHVVAEHLAGRQNHEKLLWTLLNLELWQRQQLERAPVAGEAPA